MKYVLGTYIIEKKGGCAVEGTLTDIATAWVKFEP